MLMASGGAFSSGDPGLADAKAGEGAVDTARYPANGVIAVYNQFPRFYSGIDEMTAYLRHIQEMGFNTVWLGPVQKCSEFDVPREMSPSVTEFVSGSIYAMSDHEEFNPDFGVTESNLRAYAARARELGLIPIFDLVPNHVARDARRIFGLFPDQTPGTTGFIKDKLFNDAFKINYVEADDETLSDFGHRVLETLWRPFIFRYICDFGFHGVRIDAIKQIQPCVLQRLCAIIQEAYSTLKIPGQPIILGELLYGETMGKKASAEIGSGKFIRGIGLTHVLNSVSHELFLRSPTLVPGQGGIQAGDWVLSRINRDRNFLINGNPAFTGGTISYVGNHDKGTLTHRLTHEINAKLKFIDDVASIPPDKFLEKKKEFFFFVAFASDAGWYSLAGDECGYDPARRYLTFRGYAPANWAALYTTEEYATLSQFILCINQCLKELSALIGTTESAFWVERFWFESADHPVVAIVRHYPGHLHEVIMADCSTSTTVEPFNQSVLRAFFDAQISAGGAFAEAVMRDGQPYNLSLIANDGFARMLHEAPAAVATVAGDDEALAPGK